MTKIKDKYAQSKYNIFGYHYVLRVTMMKTNFEDPAVLLVAIMWAQSVL